MNNTEYIYNYYYRIDVHYYTEFFSDKEWAIAEQKELEKKEHKYKSGREEDSE